MALIASPISYDRYMPPIARIICTSSENATTAASDLQEKISLVVTSPPYHNAISYISHEADADVNYRQRENLNYSADYLPLLARVWDQCFKMLRPGGHLAVNVGSVLDSGFHYPLPQDIQAQLDSAGWEFVRNILWNKVTAGVKRAGSVIQHALPGYWYPNIMTEHIIVVRKPGPDVALNLDVPPEWWDAIWDLAPVPPRTVEHPAPFPEDLPHRLIRMLTREDDFIMDPFNGAGTTTKAAFDLNRNSLGFDISEKYVEIAQQRLKNNSVVREKQLLVVPMRNTDFVPGKSRGQTRHGAGIESRRPKK
jgi:site-specific DNA-methyltransferase (adenine-specific)